MAGALLAALVSLLLLTPAVQSVEALASDLLFVHGRSNPPVASDQIVHVTIDDNALLLEGRWPWVRSRLATVVTALSDLGARVVALDLLFDEEEQIQFGRDGSAVDHDAVLADAIQRSRARVLLATRMKVPRALLGSIWKGPEGDAMWTRLMHVLASDITMDEEEAVTRAKLDRIRAQRVRTRTREYKLAAIRLEAKRLRTEGLLSEEALKKALLPPAKRYYKSFPEQRLLKQAIAELKTLDAFRDKLLPLTGGFSPRHSETIRAPIPLLAEVAAGTGFVDGDPDEGGTLRTVTVRWEHDGKIFLQLGVAAAMAFRDLGQEDVEMGKDYVRVGETTLPLTGERMLLAWPRIDPERGALGFNRHIPIGHILSLVDQEAKLKRQTRERLKIARALLAVGRAGEDWVPGDLDDPDRADAAWEALRAEMQFAEASGPPDEELDEEDPEDGKIITIRRFLRLDRNIASQEGRVMSERVRLQNAVKGKLVFLGWTATGALADIYPTAADERTPGVVAHASVANSVLTGYTVRRASPLTGVLLSIVLGVLAALLANATDPRLGFLVSVLLASLYVTIATLVFFDAHGVMLAMVVPVAAVASGAGGTIVDRAVLERREKAQLRRQFGARVSKQLFDFLVAHPDVVDLAGQEREVTCFFSDLAGFTAISESLDSRTTVKLLNRYMWEMNDELSHHNAYVNKFLGDGIMAVWGAFSLETPHAQRAASAALACMARLDRLNQDELFRELPDLSMRIGIATGIVTVGDCGAPPDLRDYTVIGDSVNLAARLESANKQFGTKILVNGKTQLYLGESILTRPLGAITVVGQEIPTQVHELVALADRVTDEQRRLVEETAHAVALFKNEKLDEAHSAWSRILELHGQEKLARLYLSAIDAYRENGGRDFRPVIRLVSK